jgi:hypothetical protein
VYKSTYSLTQYQLEVSGRLHATVGLLMGKSLRYPLDRGWVSPRTTLDDMGTKKSYSLRGLKIRPFAQYLSPTPHFRTETDPVSETLRFLCFLEYRTIDKVEKRVILSVVCHHQNHLEPTSIIPFSIILMKIVLC